MFGKDFVWGAATAAYQIEGGAYEDGKGLSVWDTFCQRPGKIQASDTGDVACDSYHRFKEDVAIMKELGLKGYRFSIAWTRILPNGTGEVNQKGVDYYNALIDELLANGIEPFVTLFHWDYPNELFYKGAWLNAESPDWFAEYARICAKAFGDRVKHFITFNEPQCFIGNGFNGGGHAPSLNFGVRELIRMAHHVMLAHGKAVMAMREVYDDLKIGYAPTGSFFYPQNPESQADIDVAYNKTFETSDGGDDFGWTVAWWLDPILLGKYPEDGLKIYEKYLPQGWQDDLKIISQPIDFCGQNLYNGYGVRAGENGELCWVKRYVGFPHTGNMWPVTPEAIKWCALFTNRRYGNIPIYFTENGMAGSDVISLDGKVHDPNRIDFIHRYLKELSEAIDMGANVKGYFQWSLLDNFEWSNGYRDRFGIVYVDYPTGNRIIKDSGYWYKDVIASNGENL
ncbi:MAG: beta-glucosidase [Clostridia bacterium]|nr:beta-glucosidase [Clostridia bacterium]MBQ9958578.1 beta-glucosidase [Clostridia bacterium]